MTNVREILESIKDFSEYASTRALELLKARGLTMRVVLDKIDFDEDEVFCIFKEDTAYSHSEYRTAVLSIIDLEMSDSDWEIYINELTITTLSKKADQLKFADERMLDNKRKQFFKLKQELGY